MTRRLLLLDMDGPLAAFDAKVWEVANDAGLTLDINDPSEQTKRYFTDHIEGAASRKWMQNEIRKPGWFASLPPTPGALTGVQMLIEQGVDIWVATKPMEENPSCRDDKAKWLREYLPMLERKLIIIPDKSLLNGDVLLDDAPKPAWIMKATWKVKIFAAPFNGDGSVWEGLPRWTWGDGTDSLFRV